VRDGVLVKNGNGMSQKWPLVKKDSGIFLVMCINRTKKLSIKAGGSQIPQFHWCRNIHSHDNMFHHGRDKPNGEASYVNMTVDGCTNPSYLAGKKYYSF
jgi:hypothetical protein